MVAGKSPESLPPGFAEKVKYKNGRKIRYYYNAATGAKYHSKKELIRATTDNELLDTPQTKHGDSNGGLCSIENADAMLVRTIDTPEWLPEGWIMEEKRRQNGSSKGSSYKVYTHMSSGRKFYSRAAVIHYLNILGHNKTTTVQNEDAIGCPTEDNESLGTPRTTNDNDNGLSSDKKVDEAMVVKENDTPQWLPEGWIMEEKTRQGGSTKGTTYKVYIELSSGKKFYSKAAVTQYLNAVGHSFAMVVQNEVPVKTNNSSERLPEGWVVEEKTRQNGIAKGSTYKVYIDSSSGKRFYSRNAVTQHLNTINHGSTPTVQNKDDIGCGTAENQFISTPQTAYGNVPANTTDSSEWLPDGWEVEEKTRQSGRGKGSTYKVYIEWSSGSKFYSKAAVARYLNTVNHADLPAQENTLSPVVPSQGIFKISSGDVSEEKNQSNLKTITSEITAADGLPPGWTKEIKTSKSGSKIRRDPFYTDPISGYVFRSKLDALRYVETNDIRRCACRPFKRDSGSLKLINNDIPSSNARGKKSSKKKRRPFLGGASYGGGTSGTKSREKSKAKISKQAEGNDNAPNHEASIANGLGTKRRLSSSEVRAGKQTDGIRANSRKSKKRRDSELLTQNPRRLSDASSVNVADMELENASENPHLEKLEDQSDIKKSPESQLGYDFGDSWSDPVEFALKTLCGEIPAEDNPLPVNLNEGLDKPLDGSLNPLQQSDEPTNFKSEFVPSPEPLKRHGALALLQSNPTFLAAGDVSFNGQSSTEGGKKDNQSTSDPLGSKTE